MASCKVCRKSPATHSICYKMVCQSCYDALAATPEGQKEIAWKRQKLEEAAAKASVVADRKAALSDEERKAESDRESEAIHAQNAAQGRHVNYDDAMRKHYKGE